MATYRHVFVCKDGNPLPEWLKLPGKIECVPFDGLRVESLSHADIVWIRSQQPGTAGGVNTELMRRVAAVSRMIVLADVPDDEGALAAFSAGARGYCNAHTNSRVLRLIVSVVRDGGLWIGESLMQRLVLGVGKTLDAKAVEKKTDDIVSSLTSREREVAETIAGGASNKEVARLLQISERTVKAHLSTIFNKLDVRDRLQLTIKIKMLK